MPLLGGLQGWGLGQGWEQGWAGPGPPWLTAGAQQGGVRVEAGGGGLGVPSSASLGLAHTLTTSSSRWAS